MARRYFMKNRLFDNKYQKYSKEALILDGEIGRALEPIFKKWESKGYSPREISHIITLSTLTIECERVLFSSMKTRKSDKPE